MVKRVSPTDVTAFGGEGRRARNMRDKYVRIFDAAAGLFAEAGFEAVTTHAISERADVAAGTLFRYAASKGELLLMVYNEHLRRAIADGRMRSETVNDPAGSVVAMVEPIMMSAQQHPGNAAIYQRELLFGQASDGYRSAGLQLVTDLESAIASRLRNEVAERIDVDATALGEAALRAARSVFAVLHIQLAQPSTGVYATAEPQVELEAQIVQIVKGFLADCETDT